MTGREALKQPNLANLIDPYPAEDFDVWAQTYDTDVLGDEFPFTGYTRVLETMLRLAEVETEQSVLDLGDGRILIAVLAFTDRLALQTIKQAAGLAWEDEFYWIAAETLPALAQAGLTASFHPVSSCAGVFVIPKP